MTQVILTIMRISHQYFNHLPNNDNVDISSFWNSANYWRYITGINEISKITHSTCNAYIQNLIGFAPSGRKPLLVTAQWSLRPGRRSRADSRNPPFWCSLHFLWVPQILVFQVPGIFGTVENIKNIADPDLFCYNLINL